ncbi:MULTISPECIES: hypothetical protein [unclassified Nocardioides]|uniref:hypothetical protein n=1 Tax=unclassified Nocardioides TaxID=2615069 RepID=UPI0006FF69C5|nr:MULTISPECIES: hypothetical protein [unclassified Nocardioides]KRA38987.1 hypothetical protein ASD81_10515 [Nocardioides sp. Root614]KRA92946.1 hypothetical protein ASD84_10780 [Nocardioides sp. Root682]
MSGQQRAWGWAVALRGGSTIPWQGWLDQAEPGEAEPFATYLPGAQQLGLLRRANVAAQAAGRTLPRATADRILAAGVTGRGRGDLPVLGAGEPERFGPRPVDPDALPAHELLRVAAGLIADDIAAIEEAPPQRRGLAERVRDARRPQQAPFVVVGVPWRARAVTAALEAQGLRPGGRGATAYLLADDLGAVVADAWTARAFDQGGPTWQEFVEIFATAGRLPPRADLPRMAAAATQRYGADQVRVVIDTSALAAELGVPGIPEPPRLGANGVDLVRRVGQPLGGLVPSEARPRLLRGALVGRLDGRGGPTPTVPRNWETWLATQAERTHHEIAAAGYPVLGDLDRLLPGPLAQDTVEPDATEVLALALGLLLDPVRPPVKEAT